MDFESTVSMRAYLRLQESDPQKYREERPSFEEIEEKKSEIYHKLWCKIDEAIHGDGANEKTEQMKVDDIADIYESLMREHFFSKNSVFYFGP